ncbi:N-6 DNA methylase [Micromonospora sp. NPDC005652]|uniref:N-6 DNA methylase n=1 Tax=Micromonospora sp. NPDC005652 TaxID=3157046 RepID=UPI00340BBF43
MAVAEMASAMAGWTAQRDQRPLPGLLRGQIGNHGQPTQGWIGRFDDSQTVDGLLNTLRLLAVTRRGLRCNSFLSDESIRQVMHTAAFARLKPGSGDLTILDPAAGSGSLLLDAAREATKLGYRPILRGVEIDRDAATLAAAILFIEGFDAEIEVADTLTHDPFSSLTADLALSHLPLVRPWRDREAAVREAHEAGRYTLGLPGTSDASWLFAAYQMEKLVRDGRAVILMAKQALSSGDSDAVRQAILTSDLLESVIALPSRIPPDTSTPLVALVLTNAKVSALRGKVQIVDLRTSPRQAEADPTDSPRGIRAQSVAALREALQGARNGPISRVVPTEFFFQEQRTIRSGSQLSWTVDVGRQATEKEVRKRYGPVAVEMSAAGRVSCRLEFDRLFDPAASATTGWLDRTRWPATRLSALLVSAPSAVSSADPAGVPPDVVSVPVTPVPDVVAGVITSEAAGRTRYLWIEVDTVHVLPGYLVSWLNSPHGRDARVRANAAASSGTVISAIRTQPRALLRFCDELVVPLPPLSVQSALATAEARLSAVSELVESVRRDVWNNPARIGEVKQRFDPLFDRSLASWATDLPYPVASALWTLETQRSNPHAAHDQLMLVWEAYAAFFATVLLSALAQDSLLLDEELPQLRESLARGRLSFELSTLGTWSQVVQRLSSQFRRRLRSADSAERQGVLDLFGGASAAALEQLLSAEVAKLVADANSKRNLWKGHTGTINEAELNEHIDYLTAQLHTLREITGSAWAELLCVRAAAAYRKKGVVKQHAELVAGVSVPFRTVELTVGEIMEQDALYLCVNNAARPLPLLPLVQLRRRSDSAQDTCYFYSKQESAKTRMISYHLGATSEIGEEMPEVDEVIQMLTGTEPAT